MNDRRFHPLKAKPAALQELLRVDFPLSEGKMFGVLLVEKDGELGYLQAYSGQMEGMDEERFVPPVFDYLQPDGYFKTHEEEISAINRRIAEITSSEAYLQAHRNLEIIRREATLAVNLKKEEMAKAKALRDRRRESGGISEEESREMTRQSQFLKAEVHRAKKHFSELLSQAEAELTAFGLQLSRLKSSRKQKSDQLQRWLFFQFVLLNADGQAKNLLDIFHDYYLENSPARTRIAQNARFNAPSINEKLVGDALLPPSGAGECCEPKLLQYAFRHGMKALEMVTFWLGPSPKNEVRQHGQVYPPCNGKCKPILAWMLNGRSISVCQQNNAEAQPLEVIYEDDEIAVVNKPSGMLSVPGRSSQASVYSIMKARWADCDSPVIVHRLDMDTSGLLILAKDKASHENLQKQFLARTVKKRYVALLPHSVLDRNVAREGVISLPLRPDENDRPRQIVDFQNGKPATTLYRIIGEVAFGKTQTEKAVKIELQPLTGRTHQLRVHCAHTLGLGTPIIGDTLYGKSSDRLYLHAESIVFVHPKTGREMKFEVKKWEK